VCVAHREIMIANLQYAWTLFVGPLQAGTGWRLSDIQFAFTLFILFQTWVQPLDGWLIDRLGLGSSRQPVCSAVSGGQASVTRRRSR
jgi:MFS family permease